MSDHWIEQSTKNPYVRLVALLGGLVLLGVILYALRGVLTPVFIAFLIAYLLDPIVDRFEARGVNRTLAIVILMVVLFIITGLMLVLIGLAVSEIADAIKDFPQWLEATIREWRTTWQQQPVVVWVTETLGIDIRSVDTDGAIAAVRSLRERLVGLLPNLVGPVRAIVTHALSGTVTLVAWIANIILIPLIAFYLLRDFDKIIAQVSELVPGHFRGEITRIFKEIDQSIAAFVRGQLLVMVILGVLYGIGLTVFKVKMGFGIGLLAGLLCIVPYLGFFIGMGLALLMSLMGGDYIWLNLIGTVVTFGVVQILEGAVITPKVVGDKVGLHPVWVIVALMVGAHALGVLGMLLAIPAAAVIKILLKRAIVRYRQSRFFDRGAAEEEAAEPAPNADADADAEADAEADADADADTDGDADEADSPSSTGTSTSNGTATPVGSASIRSIVDAVAREPERDASSGSSTSLDWDDDDPEQPDATADPTMPALAPLSPGKGVPGTAPEDEAWAERIGQSRTSRPGGEVDRKKSSAETLPNHPVGPKLQQVIEEAKARDRASAPPSAKEDTGTLHGLPAKKTDGEDSDE